MANNQEATGLIQAKADPPFFSLAVRIVNLGQRTGVKEDSSGLLEGHAMVPRVSFGLHRIPFELILELVSHGVIVSRAPCEDSRHNEKGFIRSATDADEALAAARCG